MKLRILNNSIRLRLSQTEVDTFAETGQVSAQTHFGTQTLTYTLSRAEVNDVQASLSHNEITVAVPIHIADKWLSPEEVGFDNEGQTETSVLVEKDFQCLHKRPNEDESDSFPNPLATH
ncbi:hypothetical protein BFP72_03830 [Reichenbachiella sp. 5M10]|uniref:DUF7009 family protein n=1 Tax=Reichenbachiella sp. 5M10 TaxID=1889772 RepID=UPI000C1526C1|nr:hypothetical protein [Reichenbachiella sp. 5M10]PIB34600.1 hypothetical protein BFP72_03830 [Reichenbachiella sp. 5M10]